MQAACRKSIPSSTEERHSMRDGAFSSSISPRKVDRYTCDSCNGCTTNRRVCRNRRTSPLASPVPHRCSAEQRWTGREKKYGFLPACGRKSMSIMECECFSVRAGICGLYIQCKPQVTAKSSAEAAFPVPPRRAHGTLQPEGMKVP